jgi:chitin disaccharide deacetylase
VSGIRLIVNADDFGFTRDVNDGIVEAHRDGILTATTLMAGGDAFEHAVGLARENPSLDVGCHLVLVERWSAKDLAWALTRGEDWIYREFARQVRKVVKAGIQPSHLDTHKHAHLLPAAMNAMARVAREFGIKWVRRTFGYTPARVPHDLNSTDHFAGFKNTGNLDRESLIAVVEGLPAGLTEFMCHPGKLGPELRGAATRLKESRAIELAALTSGEVREAIARRGVALVNYSIVNPFWPGGRATPPDENVSART